MTHTYSVSGMTCAGCAATVKKSLASISGVETVDIDLNSGSAIVSLTQPVPFAHLQNALSAYPSYKISDVDAAPHPRGNPFWNDSQVWMRASFNTLNCLIGCSIGDFAMVIFLQRYYPSTSMTAQMILATLAGLVTSVSMETTLLKTKEKFSWRFALQTALSMSFISMIAMELVINATDFMITGGKAAFGNPLYWSALVVAMAAGFLAPLPYNYYKLKKFNKACH
jgi:copper chaperone CopZ